MTKQPASLKRLHALLVVGLLALVGLLVASPVGAKPLPKFSGDAPGSVTCGWSAKVSFSPPLTHSGGGTSPSQVTGGKLSSCTASDARVTITKGTFTGSFASSPLDCTTPSTTGASASLTITWKGSLNGTVGGTTYAGKAKFTPSDLTGTSVTGSFGGTSALTVNVPFDLAELCGAKRGLMKTTVTGTFAATAGGADAVSVVSDSEGYCAVLRSSGVDCWGDNSNGELGNGTTTGPDCSGTCNPTPGSVIAVGGSGPLTGVASLATYEDGEAEGYCALLTSGSVDCWGDNTYGELGDSTASGPDCSGTCSATPVSVSGVTTAIALANDGEGYCALLMSGSVDCWGDNSNGELGNGTTTGPDCSGTCNPAPGAVSGITSATILEALGHSGGGYCAVVTTPSSVKCWGYGLDGELGNNSGASSDVPVIVTAIENPSGYLGEDIPVISLIGSDKGYCAIQGSPYGPVNTVVSCWGDNVHGELGNGLFAGSNLPTAVNSPVSDEVVSLVSAPYPPAYCAVLTSGSAYCWGDNSSGELGDNLANDSNVPVEVDGVGGSGTLNDVVSLASDAYGADNTDDYGASFCALLTSTGVDCWGADPEGQLGNNSLSNSNVPVAVEGVGGSGSLTGVASLADGWDTSCAVLTSGGVDCWGDDGNGELGNGATPTNYSEVPVAVSSLGP